MKKIKGLLKNRTVLGILLLLFAAILIIVTVPIFNNMFSEKTEVLRFKGDYVRGTVISDNMLELATVGKYNIPKDVETKPEKVVGKVLNTNVFKEDYVAPSKYSDELLGASQMMADTDGLTQIVSVKIDNTNGMCNLLESGDIVSLYAIVGAQSMSPDELTSLQKETVVDEDGCARRMSAATASRLINELNYVEVVESYNASNLSTHDVSSDNANPTVTTLVLKCTQAQADKLIYYTANGYLHATLACKYDNKDTKEKLLKYQSEILDMLSNSKTKPEGSLPDYKDWLSSQG